MNPIQMKKIIEQTARLSGGSAEEVRREISTAISEAVERCRDAGNGAWSRVACSGELPTPEELLAYLVEETKRGLGH